ncbi:MAG: transporter, partial [Synechococcaceae cyanobacterium SM2_3_60]|nr:transporter [Synechococcaceae cyanobacterium SM2_3_60]
MVDWQGWLAITAFLGVMALVITEVTHLMIAALLGALLLIFSNVLNLPEAIDYISRGHQTLALFLGVMILVRSFEPTKVFDHIAIRVLILAQGSGKLILLSIVALTSVICSVLPNATTVLLLGPLLPPIATKLGLEFIPLLILMVLTANSAGLLTLVGDPATYIVGDAIN